MIVTMMRSILGLFKMKNLFYIMVSSYFLVPFFSHADEEKSNIKIIIPANKDGGLDYTGRLLGEFVSDEKIIKNVNIENFPGAGGEVGIEHFLKIDPKENTFLIASLGVLVADTDGSLSKEKKLMENLLPIGVIAEDYAIIAVHYDSSYKNLEDLLKSIKKEPSKFKIFGGSKVKGLDHLNFLVAAKTYQIDSQNIQYVPSNGGGEGYQKFMKESNAILSTSFSENIRYVNNKKIKILAVCSKKKLKTLPDVPTFKESGIPDCLINYRIVYVNKNSSPSKLKFYQDVIHKIYSSKNWNDFSKDNHIINIEIENKDFATFIAERKEHIKKMISFIEKK